MNFEADMLANATSNISPHDDCTSDKFSMEIIYTSSILDNIMSWRIFNDEKQIINSLHSEDTFKGSIIDEEQHEALLQPSASENKPQYNNTMPKDIIHLEKLFYL